MKLQLARLDARDVEQFVDEPTKPSGLRVQQIQPLEMRILLLEPGLVIRRALIEPPLHAPYEHLRQTRDRRQRRLQLVRGHRQEARLELIELFQLLHVLLRVAVQAGDLLVSAGQIVHALLERGSCFVDTPLQIAIQIVDRGVGSFELDEPCFQLDAQLPSLDAARDYRAQLINVARLDQVVVRALAQRLDRRL